MCHLLPAMTLPLSTIRQTLHLSLALPPSQPLISDCLFGQRLSLHALLRERRFDRAQPLVPPLLAA